MSENTSRKLYYVTAVALVAMVLIAAVAVTRPPTEQPTSSPSTKTLQVTGTGTVSSVPDRVLLTLAVDTQGATANNATSGNTAAMTNVLSALANTGVTKSEIETISYSLTPIYENRPCSVTQGNAPCDLSQGQIIGYTVSNVIQVTLNDTTAAGRILDAAVAAGVNDVQGITFTLSSGSMASLQRQAMQLAVQDADNEAKAVASSLGLTLSGPIAITPGYTYQPMVQRFNTASAATTPIQPGSLQVSATVQITYAFN